VAFGTAEEDNILVYIFLRGGMDGLQFCAPVSDQNYQTNRNADIRISESGDKKGLLLNKTLSNLDFALHSDAKPLFELYQSGKLALVHAAGLTNGTRSHFDAQDIIEKGLAEKKGALGTGWLARYLNQQQFTGQIPALGAQGATPLSLLGYPDVLTMANPNDFKIYGEENVLKLLEATYADADPLLAKNALKTINTVRFLHNKKPTHDQLADYPVAKARDELGKGLRSISELIKMDCGLRVATVDMGGWDTHYAQPYRFNKLIESLSESLQLFYNSIPTHQNKVTVVVMSEFGRRFKGNKSNGTDHGHGNAMMVLGGKVNGGKMYGTWPGLATEQLDHGVDLRITTDYRTVLAEVLAKRMNPKNLNDVFPGIGEEYLGMV
jgi:uncharacterized protein (DUF1501 family)